MFTAKFDILSFCFQKQTRNKFVCVSWDKTNSNYKAQISHEHKQYYCGCFLNELEAAQAVNAKCVELDISLKNPEVGLPDKRQVRFKESNA